MIVAFTEPLQEAAFGLVFVGLAGPYVAMIGHLSLSRELSPAERVPWRRELWWGHRSIVAVWTYLLAKDLHQASAELGKQGGEWWKP
jgi:hypothetical protein